MNEAELLRKYPLGVHERHYPHVNIPYHVWYLQNHYDPKYDVPKGWDDFDKIGKRMPATPFICCKTPLGPLSMRERGKKKWFRTEELIAACRVYGRLALVINLSEYEARYPVEDITATGAKHVHIPLTQTRYHDWLTGEGADAKDAKYAEFEAAVDANRALHGKSNRALIAVHCTHGANRTGYMVCRYLMTTMAYSAERAINVFQNNRNSYIKSAEVVAALHALGAEMARPKETTSSTSAVDEMAKEMAANTIVVDEIARGKETTSTPNTTVAADEQGA